MARNPAVTKSSREARKDQLLLLVREAFGLPSSMAVRKEAILKCWGSDRKLLQDMICNSEPRQRAFIQTLQSMSQNELRSIGITIDPYDYEKVSDLIATELCRNMQVAATDPSMVFRTSRRRVAIA